MNNKFHSFDPIFSCQNHLRRASNIFSSDIYLPNTTKISYSTIQYLLRENSDNIKQIHSQVHFKMKIAN